MAEEICPFCTKKINKGAVVCAACGAFKGPARLTYSEGTNLANGIVYLIYLVTGPGALILTVFALFAGGELASAMAFGFWGILITWGGGWFLKRVFLDPGEKIIWMRR